MPGKKLELLLTLDNSKFKRALKAATKSVSRSTSAMVSAAKPVAAGFDRIAKSVATVGTAATLAAGAVGFYKLKGVLAESIGLANVQAEAEAKLAAVVKATGNAAGLTAEQMAQFASELQAVTTFGDEVTISAQAILASFKNIKGDQFRAATRAAQDMATVMGTDLNSTILQVGKALNDPVKGLSALSRAGVQFTESQKAQIKALQASGDIMGAQKIILKELAGQFGGAAEAVRRTFGGAVTAAKNALGDLQEQIGFAFTENSALIAGAKEVEQVFIRWTGVIKNNEQQMKQLAVNSTIALLEFGQSAVNAASASYQAFVSLNKTLLLSYTSILRMAAGYIRYREIIYSGIGDEKKANEMHRLKLELLGKIPKQYDKILKSEQRLAKAKSWAEAAGEQIEKLKETIETTEIDPAEAIKEDTGKVDQKLVRIGETWVNVTEESLAEINKTMSGGMEESTATVGDAGKKNVDYWLDSLAEMSRFNTSYVDRMVAELERLQAVQRNTATGYSSGGSVRGFASGGRLPGYGGGDRIPALLEAGEFIVRKEAVARFGSGLFHALNNLQLPSMPKFAAGGAVAAGAAGETVNINLTLPGASAPVTMSGSKSTAKQLLRDVARMQRLRS